MSPQNCSWSHTPFARLRQVFRRFSWFLLFLPLPFLYPYVLDLVAWHAQVSAAAPDRDQAIAAALAKVVDVPTVLTKGLIGLGLFIFVNALGWAALKVTPVLPGWAKGEYSTQEKVDALGIAAPVVGFKRTFLTIAPAVRLGFYVFIWTAQLCLAVKCFESAFTIQ